MRTNNFKGIFITHKVAITRITYFLLIGCLRSPIVAFQQLKGSAWKNIRHRHMPLYFNVKLKDITLYF